VSCRLGSVHVKHVSDSPARDPSPADAARDDAAPIRHDADRPTAAARANETAVLGDRREWRLALDACRREDHETRMKARSVSAREPEMVPIHQSFLSEALNHKADANHFMGRDPKTISGAAGRRHQCRPRRCPLQLQPPHPLAGALVVPSPYRADRSTSAHPELKSTFFADGPIIETKVMARATLRRIVFQRWKISSAIDRSCETRARCSLTIQDRTEAPLITPGARTRRSD